MSSLGVSHYNHKITNLWKFGLDWSSKLWEKDERKNTLVGRICVLSDKNKRLLARSLLLFIMINYLKNSSPMLVTKSVFKLILVLSNYQTCTFPLSTNKFCLKTEIGYQPTFHIVYIGATGAPLTVSSKFVQGLSFRGGWHQTTNPNSLANHRGKFHTAAHKYKHNQHHVICIVQDCVLISVNCQNKDTKEGWVTSVWSRTDIVWRVRSYQGSALFCRRQSCSTSRPTEIK